MNKDLLSIKDLKVSEIKRLFSLTRELKKRRKRGEKIIHLLDGKNLGLLFEKPSTRTRISFEIAMRELGGNSLFLPSEQMQMKRGETIEDTGRVLSGYLDGLVFRTYNHQILTKLARASTIPVINGLSDLLHPCQVLSDMFTIERKKGDLKSIKLVFVGAGNNVCNSWIYASAKMDIHLVVSSPRSYQPERKILEECRKMNPACHIELVHEVYEAVKGADIIYTDVWVSMGEEQEREKRMEAFRDFQVNQRLLQLAKKDVLVMHCLPAHRGEEIASDVLDGPHSIVWEEAENRLHLQKALLVMLLGEGNGQYHNE
ncbi:MAG TPA: ornithine carbamoyltransferase [Candidatus Omnitrophica bacterium]|nr:ornithine carbamoyltransferase [Candidatus Omnitrophota bacterium]